MNKFDRKFKVKYFIYVIHFQIENRLFSANHTITSDNGKEFAEHEAIAGKLRAGFYFAHPYGSWERGLNENINGLIQQYFPIKMDFSSITTKKVKNVMDKLNHRPEKILDSRTPHEVFFNINVALQN